MIAELPRVVLREIHPAGEPNPWSCSRCNKLLGRVRVAPDSFVEIKCPKCGQLNQIRQLLYSE